MPGSGPVPGGCCQVRVYLMSPTLPSLVCLGGCCGPGSLLIVLNLVSGLLFVFLNVQLPSHTSPAWTGWAMASILLTRSLSPKWQRDFEPSLFLNPARLPTGPVPVKD